jgi:phosphoribosylglycinamide formyltransferase 1
MRVGVLASGGGTNLQALLDTVHGRQVDVVAVASDQPGARALERARGAGVAARVFERSAYPDRAARDVAIADWLDEREVALVVLAGYMAILDDAFLERFAGRIVNVHPSLLPAFPGVRAIEQALAYGAKVFGVTVHFVEPGAVDSGPIILQGAVELPDARDAAEVLAALRPLEHTLLPRAVAAIAAGRVRRDPDHPRRIVVDERAPARGP